MSNSIQCIVCGRIFWVPASHVKRRFTCSMDCRTRYQRRFEISADALRRVVWLKPVESLAKTLGVSGKAVEKRCNRLGIPKPPRGYWAKIRQGISRRQALLDLGWKARDIERLEVQIS